ncbi:uncharacterized protein LOC132567165 isoform X2 [Heteronotia binoei]|uniref:uncharacterized protein LOC132567165 isoform X2 n=1 Tax=Heteronotia binoei TaxID=13085 RepID=UPI00293062D3|nr:uncharacterized protein LOC132567165 isoform X2 [Heteronotia binoei]
MEEKQVVVSGEQALSQDASPFQRSIEDFLRRWLENRVPPRLMQTLLQCLHKMAPWVHTMIPVETLGNQDIPSPERLFRCTKKQLGTLIRFLLAFVPFRFHWVWEYFLVDTIAGNLIPEELKKILIHPSRQGSRRDQGNLAQEEKTCWVEAIQGALPDEDDPEDSTYEPTKSECESEEYTSQNDTETDLEIMEEDGVMMLKEQLNQQGELRGHAELQELEQWKLESPSLGDGSEHPGTTAAPSGQGQDLDSQEAGESRPDSECPDISLSSDSQDQWVELSGKHARCHGQL